ncbi:FliO/MopB family protein [bacterium]|nr:FliO/MopB family protein [bacterium]
MTIDYTNFILSLIFVIMLIFPVIWLIKRLSIFGTKKDAIDVIDKKLIAPGIYIALTKILDKYYVLGLSSGSVSLIKEINDPDELEKIKKIYDVKQEFNDVLSTKVNSMKKRENKSYFQNGHQNLKKHIESLEDLVIKKK